MIFTNCLLEKRQTIHEKIQFLHIFGLKTKKFKIVSDFILKNFLRAFQRRFQNSKIFTASGDIQQKTQKTTK